MNRMARAFNEFMRETEAGKEPTYGETCAAYLEEMATELGPVLDTVLDTVLVGGEWRVVGAVSAEDLEELGRMADVGDELRAESRLALLRRGRPV